MAKAVAISGSPSRQSRSRRLAVHALEAIARSGIETAIVDLSELPAEALLGRARSTAVDEALSLVTGARILVVSTPVYRASCSGLLKVFFDLLPVDGLAGIVAIPIATGGGMGHALVIDHVLRPLLASVAAVSVATGVYGADAQFTAAAFDDTLAAGLGRAAAEALTISAQLSLITRS